MTDTTTQQATISEAHAGKRLDQVLPLLFPDYSRSRLQQLLKSGNITVDNAVWRQRDRVAGHEVVSLHIDDVIETSWQAQDIPLNLVYEDDHIIVVNKPLGLVVHPAAGNRDGTLLNALLHHDPSLARLPRAGIVHRIDKDTSGLLVIARSELAHKVLVDALKEKNITREYLAITQGVMTGGGTVDAPIGRHPRNRVQMAVVRSGKPAVTHYRVVQRFRAHTCIRVMLETGRTHQIRVHMAYIHYPLVGDPVYGGRPRPPAHASDSLLEQLSSFRHQALHATKLVLRHPASGETMEWECPPPEDFQQLLLALERDSKAHGHD